MRLAATVFLLAPALFGAEIRIDHVTICGAKLDDLRRSFQATAGVAPEYGGPHSNRATEMALVSFPDGSYVELMGFQAAADPAAAEAHYWSRFLKANAGPCAFALRVPDVGAESARLKAAGIEVSALERTGRTRPDGTKLEWESAAAGTATRGTFFPFLIRDFTPREARVYPSGKPTTAKFDGVARVLIGVRDLDAAVARYRKAFGLAAPRVETSAEYGARVAWFDGAPVALAQGRAGTWIARRVDRFGEAPCAITLKGSRGSITLRP